MVKENTAKQTAPLGFKKMTFLILEIFLSIWTMAVKMLERIYFDAVAPFFDTVALYALYRSCGSLASAL